MKAVFRVDEAGAEQEGTFFTGEIVSGILVPGMEAVTAIGAVEVASIMNTTRTKEKKRALPTQQVCLISARGYSPSALVELKGQKLEFTDQKTILLKKGIFLNAEPG